jgi:hypothetical protein
MENADERYPGGALRHRGSDRPGKTPVRISASFPILGSVGLLGVALAAIGLYGVLLCSATRRIREIGLRIALGATSYDVLPLVLRQSVVWVGGS